MEKLRKLTELEKLPSSQTLITHYIIFQAQLHSYIYLKFLNKFSVSCDLYQTALVSTGHP